MKALLYLLLFNGVVAVGWAQDPGLVFQHANQEYQGGNFEGARDQYESLLANGYESSSLYYNLGNAYFKLGDIARAILNYERALILDPTDEDLKYNLELSNLMTVDKIEPAPRLFVWDYWDEIKGVFPPEGILWMTYTAYALILLSLSFLVAARSYLLRKTAMAITLVSTILFFSFLVIAVARFADISDDDHAVVVADIATIKNSPDSGSTDAFVLHAGVKVRILDRISGWLMIRLADGKVGWIDEVMAEII